MDSTKDLQRRDFLRFVGSSSLLLTAGLIEFPGPAEGSKPQRFFPLLAGVEALVRERLGPASSFADWTEGLSFSTKTELNSDPLVYIALPSESVIRDANDLLKGAVVETIVAEGKIRFAGREIPEGQYFLWLGTIDVRGLPKDELAKRHAGIPLRNEVRRDGMLVVAALVKPDGEVCIVDPWVHYRLCSTVEGEDFPSGWFDGGLFELSPIALLTRCPPEQRPLGRASLDSRGPLQPRCEECDIPAVSPLGLGILGSSLMYVVYRFLSTKSDYTPDENR